MSNFHKKVPEFFTYLIKLKVAKSFSIKDFLFDFRFKICIVKLWIWELRGEGNFLDIAQSSGNMEYHPFGRKIFKINLLR